MRSIRLSLIVYFLLLLTAALGAVSWLAHQTTSQALHARQRDSENRIQGQCDAQIEAIRTTLDRRLLRQAQTIGNMARSTYVHAETMQYQLGLIGALASVQGHLHATLWLAESQWTDASVEIFRAQPLYTHIESADELIPAGDGEHAQEYFQTYRRNGSPMQRSESMEDHWFTLDEQAKKGTAEINGWIDSVELRPGLSVRRVTVKITIDEYRTISYFHGFKGMPPPSYFPKLPGKGPSNPKTKGARPPLPAFPRAPIAATNPFFYIQYASDLAPTDAAIRAVQKQRDRHLADVERSVAGNLHELRNRLLWISLLTLVGIWVGGFVVIQLGLAPLSRMSDAVSKVSAKNFDLQLDIDRLPKELRPIAARLKDVLQHLQQAFAREKQAAADISHELRTPLAALMTTLEVGLKKQRAAEDYRELLQECQASGQHMYTLVERLLTLARLDAGVDVYRPVEVDVVEIALDASDMIRPLARAKGLDLRVRLPDPIVTQTDPDKLREILVNLLHNAIEYNKPHGAIDLTVERVEHQVRLQVRDTGIGITPEGMAHIFERFFRADPSRHADTPHAGLGLSIVKSYVDLMGGAIQVESSPAGTAFTVAMPFAPAAQPTETAIQEAHALAKP